MLDYYAHNESIVERSSYSVVWPGVDNTPPSDSPACGWSNELCVAEAAAGCKYTQYATFNFNILYPISPTLIFVLFIYAFNFEVLLFYFHTGNTYSMPFSINIIEKTFF